MFELENALDKVRKKADELADAISNLETVLGDRTELALSRAGIGIRYRAEKYIKRRKEQAESGRV